MRYAVFENQGQQTTRFERGIVASITTPILRFIAAVNANGREHARSKLLKRHPEAAAMKLQITEV